MTLEDQILKVMKKEAQPLNAGKIAELLNVDKKDVEKAMNTLKKDEKIVSPKRCFWEPK